MANPKQMTDDEEPIGSHVLPKNFTENDVFDRLPKEVQDLIRNSPVKLKAHWTMLNCDKALVLKLLKEIIAEKTATPPFIDRHRPSRCA